jgi:MFS family permease
MARREGSWAAEPGGGETRLGVSRNVLLLGVVSLLTDVSSEISVTFLPFFLANVLGLKTAVIGLIEGVAESTASLTRLGSGWLSDRWRARRALVIMGYGLSALSKPFLYFANAWSTVLSVRFADRVGKGVRTSPRDALLAASAAKESRGFSFGFHRGADTAGAFLGLSVVALVIYLSQGWAAPLQELAFRRLVLVAVVPGFLAVLVLLWVREIGPRRSAAEQSRHQEPGAQVGRGYGRRFTLFLVAVGLFSLANSSDAFVLLRTQSLGLSVAAIALVLAGFNLVYSLVSPIAGRLSDRVGRPVMIELGWGLYAVTYLGFALARSAWAVWPLFALYAVYYGLAEGTARALVTDLVPDARRGTAYGLYGTVVGVTALPASLLAGLVWQGVGAWPGWGPSAPFVLGSALAGAAAMVLVTATRGSGELAATKHVAPGGS